MIRKLSVCTSAILFLNVVIAAQRNAPSEISFNANPPDCAVTFSLDATMHTVHGSFAVKKGSIQFSPATNRMDGEIVLDATSAKTGNDTRDNKMHKDVLESARFPEITFQPDHVEGTTAMQGASRVQLHGVFTIHGAKHEMTVPTEVEISPQHWQATSHFVVPYIAWGMKDPSNLFLHVKDSVEIEVKLAGESANSAKQ
jgi:polyisoprenoid-binding protein YceI